jgi:predicted phage tail protein
LNIDRNHVSFSAIANALIQRVLLAGKKFDTRGEQSFAQEADTAADLRPFSARDGQVPFIVEASGPDGTYFVRMRAVTSFGYGPPSNEVSFILGAGACESAPPLQPGPLAVVVSGVDATLTWGEAQGATSYVLEVGTSSGASNVLRTNVGSVTTISGRQLPGTYYVRVRGSNACGDGPSSNEVRVVLTTSESSPGQPLFLAAQVTGNNVLLTWAPPVGGGSVDGYRVQAGTTPTGVEAGEQDVAGTSLFAGNVPRGRYYVRVSARNLTGLGPSTPPLIVDVP